MGTLVVKIYPDRFLMARDIEVGEAEDIEKMKSTKHLIKRFPAVLLGIESQNDEEAERIIKYFSNEALPRKIVELYGEDCKDYKSLCAQAFVLDLSEGNFSKEPLQNSYIIAFDNFCFVYDKGKMIRVKSEYAIGENADIAKGALYMGASPKQAIIATRVVTQRRATV